MKVFVPTSGGESVDQGEVYALPNVPSHGAVVRISASSGSQFRFGDNTVAATAGEPRLNIGTAIEVIGIPEGATHVAVLSGTATINFTVGYIA